MAEVFNKYRLSFKVIKYHFFLPRIEYVGHYLIADGICLAKSQFQLIKEWPLSPYGISLFFIGLNDLYSTYVPWFESNIKPLRRLQRLYHRSILSILV